MHLISVDQLRIIFAGRELCDDISVDTCDLGNQSVLHAVTVITTTDTTPAPAAPLSQTMLDLQLTQEERRESVTRVNETRETRAMFYCWCDQADTLSHAKLRVKCQQCHNGAIILHTDPCSWSDVLTPHRIQGYCELCSMVTWAQFYFRCGSHKTGSDGHETVALDMIRSNIRHVPCLACTDTCETVVVFSCDHVTCTDCWSDYARLD